MEPRFWLEFDYGNKRFNYVVYDVDLMQLLDLIGELEAVALKQDVLIPSVYDMYYKGARGKKMYIRSDADLMSMFAHFEGRDTIKVWMEDTINPIGLFRLSSELKKVQREVEYKKKREAEEKARMEREVAFVQPLEMEILVVDVDTNDTEWPAPQPSPQPTPQHHLRRKTTPRKSTTKQHKQRKTTPAQATSKPSSQPTDQPPQQPDKYILYRDLYTFHPLIMSLK
ncbi:hypothetical protein RND81_10G141900 [Saponaria officinalis]|uniref:Uncharacterized protein n=1 Tax=Saponaria officinalis TaxID=3572 RepID=A0AAW1I1Y7_SAPOF